MSFRDTKDLDTEVRVNKTERKATRLVPEKGTFKEIEVGAGSVTFKMDRRGIWLGSADYDTAPFSLSMEGLFKLLSTQGLGAIGMSAEQGIWLGAEEFADAPFSVDMEGNITIKASNLTQDTAITFRDPEDKLSIYLGFKDIT